MNKTFIMGILGIASLITILGAQAQNISENEDPSIALGNHVCLAIQENKLTTQENEMSIEFEGKKWEVNFYPRDFKDFINVVGLDKQTTAHAKGSSNEKDDMLMISYRIRCKLPEEQGSVPLKVENGFAATDEYHSSATLMLTRKLSGEEKLAYRNFLANR